ncbi:MAG: DUF1616 domain-containing protein [Asgard group archaeon]|nr:DUF1616 domain-containing protein [Asgard group archaeon]
MTNEKKRKQKFKDDLEEQAKYREIDEQLEFFLEHKKPKTVRKLVELTIAKTGYTREEILQVLREKEIEEEITLQEPLPSETVYPKTFKEYFFKKNYFSIEFWISISTIILVLIFTLIDVTEGVFFYIRYIIVTFFMLILTGWSLTAAIFPELDANLRFLERIVAAIGLSIVVLVLDGLFLNYTFRFTLLSISLSLIIITIICFSIAIGLRFKLARDGYVFKKPKMEETIEI